MHLVCSSKVSMRIPLGGPFDMGPARCLDLVACAGKHRVLASSERKLPPGFCRAIVISALQP